MKNICKRKNKVLVALSGGVDSAVAAAFLVKQGYNVTAAYMVNYEDGKSNKCWVNDYRDAVRVAAKLNIPIVRLNFVKEYQAKVLDYTFKEYRAGRTPNPDVLCNKYIKFGVWLDWAIKHGYDCLATGHYARVKQLTTNKKQLTNRLLIVNCSLLVSKDTNKDQTYFLHQLNQSQLSHVLFPVGDYTKPEVRKFAAKFALPVAEKEESMGICFVGEVPMKEFLQTKIKSKSGKIVLSDGTVAGRHDGLAFYTIGQRHLGQRVLIPALSSAEERGANDPLHHSGGGRGTIVDTRPLFVVAKNIKKNELVVGFEDDPLLYSKETIVEKVNWIAGREPNFPLKCMVRLRHRQPLERCVVNSPLGRGRGGLAVVFDRPQRAVTPGQFAVFYSKDVCLGGGVIK